MSDDQNRMIPSVRCDINDIISLMDTEVRLGDSNSMKLRQNIELNFNQDVKAHGDHSEEFLKTYLSAIVFIHGWLIIRKVDPRILTMITDIGSVPARRYIEMQEAEISKKPQFSDVLPPEEIKREQDDRV